MKIAIAQTKPIKGAIEKNIEAHKKWIHLAIKHHTDFIFFPELSLTGYEPKLAANLAIEKGDIRIFDFQKISDKHQISIGIGLPTKEDTKVKISMLIFQPNKPVITYSKQYLHTDEKPYFVNGNTQAYLTIKNEKIAPAICYESLQIEHTKNAYQNNATIYIASVAKSKNGVEKSSKQYANIAKFFSMTVLMANSVGFCDDFKSVGTSAIWDAEGNLRGKLDNKNEGLLIYNTETKKVIKL